jgi:hypothetical protein
VDVLRKKLEKVPDIFPDIMSKTDDRSIRGKSVAVVGRGATGDIYSIRRKDIGLFQSSPGAWTQMGSGKWCNGTAAWA